MINIHSLPIKFIRLRVGISYSFLNKYVQCDRESRRCSFKSNKDGFAVVEADGFAVGEPLGSNQIKGDSHIFKCFENGVQIFKT